MNAAIIIILVFLSVVFTTTAIGTVFDVRQKRKRLSYDKDQNAKKWAQNEAEVLKRETVREQARRALDHGYTLDQLILWTMSQIYFDPTMSIVVENEDEIRKNAKDNESDYFTSTGAFHEGGKRRELQKRIAETKKHLFNKEITPHEALINRDFLTAMNAAGIEPKHDRWRYLMEQQEDVVENQEYQNDNG